MTFYGFKYLKIKGYYPQYSDQVICMLILEGKICPGFEDNDLSAKLSSAEMEVHQSDTGTQNGKAKKILLSS
jgi:hypothetical protein